MNHYLDWACYALLGVLVLVAASTFGVAYLDYQEQREEYAEKIAHNHAFHQAHCLDTSYLAKYPQLLDECHESKHAAYDDPGKKALRVILGRWSVCDERGCDAFLDRFGRYFSIAALGVALVVGAGCVVLVQRAARARSLETLPGGVR